jgi:hypothetical protein
MEHCNGAAARRGTGDFDRMTVEFTMLNQDKVIMCVLSTAAMDNIEGTRDAQ